MESNKNIKDTICAYAWDFPTVSMGRNGLKYCCRTELLHLSEEQIKHGSNIFNEHDDIMQLRRDLLNGVKNHNCRACWEIEGRGGYGPRTRIDKFIDIIIKKQIWSELSRDQIYDKLHKLTENEIDQLIKMQSIRSIDIQLGNTCDLKCIYCGHRESSSWAAERLRYGDIPQDRLAVELPNVDNTEFESIWWDWFENGYGNTTDRIKFLGGEPLFMEKFYTYINRIIDFYENSSTSDRPVSLSIFTNFNTKPFYYEKLLPVVLRIINSKRLKLQFNVSCESTGPRAEFIRFGLDWNIMVKNSENFIKFISDAQSNIPIHQRPISFIWQPALNALSISDLPNFVKFVIDLQDKTGYHLGIAQNQVTFPEWLNPGILSPDYSKYIDETISILNEKTPYMDHTLYVEKWDVYVDFLRSIKSLIEYEDKNYHSRKMFVANVDTLCNRRNLNFHNTFPEMVDFYNICNS